MQEDILEVGERRFVSFCDILGFSARVENDFVGTVKAYQEFVGFLQKLNLTGVAVTIYSDSIILTSSSLFSLISAVNALWFVAQTHNFLIRGAISVGRHWEERWEGERKENIVVLSEALVKAVRLEGVVSFPMVAIDPSIELPDKLWALRFRDGAALAPILHFWGRNIVNPFGAYWFASAKSRVMMMYDGSAEHAAKYEWFLALHRAVQEQADLVPEDVMDRLLSAGVISRIEP